MLYSTVYSTCSEIEEEEDYLIAEVGRVVWGEVHQDAEDQEPEDDPTLTLFDESAQPTTT
jgi:hypothetical protein